MSLHFDIEIDGNKFVENILKILQKIRSNWEQNDVKFKIFSEGITNRLIGAYCHSISEIILFRINGNKTELLIDRQAEIKNMKFLNKFGFAPEIYATFSNGICYEFTPGVILNSETVLDSKIWKLIAAKLAQLHKIPLSDEQKSAEPMILRVGKRFLEMVPEKYSDSKMAQRIAEIFPSKQNLILEFAQLMDDLKISTNSPIVFCHNDLLLSNIIYSSDTSKISFIDFEYAEANHQGFDIANHFARICGGSSAGVIDYSKYPSKEFQLKWLACYLTEWHGHEEVTAAVIKKVYKDVKRFVVASHLLWSFWCLIQAEHSDIEFDFVRLAKTYFDEYLHRKSLLK